MTIAISGATGFVGNYLKNYFAQQGHTIIALSRTDFHDIPALCETIKEAEVIINLAGAPIIKRWNKAYKKALFDSRVDTTKALVQAINANGTHPTFISTSAIGIYKDDALYDEKTTQYNETFLGRLCQTWEEEALKADARNIIFRFGIILGHGGALQAMLLPFKLGLGGTIGNGAQSFSYIHIHDLARAYTHVIEHSELKGVFNLTTPSPITNKKLTQSLAKKLKRPAFFPVPKWLLKIIYGEGASTLTKGQDVYPSHLLQSGFNFEFETIDAILEDLLQ